MEEYSARRNTPKLSADVSAPEGWTTTKAAGKVLGVSPRTIQSYIKKGYLLGRAEGVGVKRTWYVSIDSLNELRARRLAEENAETFREGSADHHLAEGIAEVVQNLSESLAETSARAAEYRTRLELTERAESSLREDLERERAERREAREELSEERQRREQAERERDELRTRLEALQKPPQAPEKAPDEPTDTQPRTEETEREPETSRPSFWRRFFGIE
jgi:hypothetical protein